jgi:hypothetical protein
MMRTSAVTLAVTLGCIGPAARAQDVSNLAGSWTMNKELSKDLEARVAEAAGSEYMSGGPSWATETWFPWGASFKEGERLEVRAFLMAALPTLAELELEFSPRELKTIHGESNARIFNLTRTSAGTSGLTGERVTRSARWQGEQLVLESKGKESKLIEVVTPVPTRRQLTYALRFEAPLLEKPLELTFVYDRAQP